MRRTALLVLVALGLGVAGTLPSARAAGDQLMVGVGRADITSPTGYYMQGWVRSDAILTGVHTRIEARAIVLKRGARKLALVAEDLNGISEGVVAYAAAALRSRGFSETNIIVSASHTHAAPSGYYAYGTYNTVFMTSSSTAALAAQNVTGKLDPQLFSFEVRQLVAAITRADNDLAPGRLGWGKSQLAGITANRSLEAHLADRGVKKAYGTGKVSDDPLGYLDTIDPEVQVLRVDKKIGGAFRPVGMWSTFADHGTVNKYTFGVYNADHHGSATRVVEAELRRIGAVPATQDVVNAYGNTDEGDQSAGLTRSGPAAADYVGRVEAQSMLAAWRSAGSHLTTTPVLDVRWTRVCFCGAGTSGGRVSSTAAAGLPLFTGSEEGRGGLYDLTHIPFEGVSNPVGDLDPAQGHKIVVTRGLPGTPPAVPLSVARVGEHLIATIPGEMTVEMGRRVRAAVAVAARGHKVTGVQLSGLVNEYLSYFTTPEEYDQQHYEGGSTMYGRESSLLLQDHLVDLTRRLLSGIAAPAPDKTDPRNGVANSAAPFGTGATHGQALDSPVSTQRLQRAAFTWQGGARGLDLPLGRPFVRIERLNGSTWTAVDNDLGLDIVWRLHDGDQYTAEWEVPRSQVLGLYRFVVTANHYRVESGPFRVKIATTLSVQGNTVRYPDAVVDQDLTYRPSVADGATVTTVGTTVPRGGAVDMYGNCNGAPATTAGPRSGADINGSCS